MQLNELSGPTAQILESLLTIGRAARKQLDSGSDQVSYWVVHMLTQRGPSRNSELASACGLDASTVSRQVRHLEEIGMVERAADPSDRRAHLISLSPDGMRRVAEAKSRRLSIVADRLADWSDHDVGTLATLLTRLAREIAPPESLGADDAAHAPTPDSRED